MSSVQEFEKIKSAEEFFEFFDIEYDEDILKTKRYLILKLFSDLTANATSMFNDEKRLEFYRFSLLKIYGDFVSGFIPTAEEVWGEAINHTCGGGSCSTGGGHGEGGGCSSGSCNDTQKTSCASHGNTHEWA